MRLRTPHVLIPLTLGLVITFAPEAVAQCNVVVDAPVSVKPDGCAVPVATRDSTIVDISTKTGAGGFKGFGVKGGSVNGEIDSSSFGTDRITVREMITIKYDDPAGIVITEIVLAFLRPMGSAFGDAVDEVAVVKADGVEYTLEATSSSTGFSSSFPGGPVKRVSELNGAFSIKNPFGSMRVHKLEFFPGPPYGLDAAGSDFSIVSVCSFPFREIGFGLGGPLKNINCGPDLGGGEIASLNFTGPAGSAGGTWLTVFDETPATPDQTIVPGSVNLSADVLIHRFNNKKGAGLLALFNEGAGQKGLALILYDAGNTDSLALATVDQAGKLTALTSVALDAGILENAWYRLTMDVVVSRDDLTVTGRVFRHTDPHDAYSTLGTQVGGTLATPNPLSLTALGLQGSGEVGIVASAISAVVDSSVTNFAVSQD